MKIPFDFSSIIYPAFVVVYGPSKSGITMYNRSEYGEMFASDVCRDAAAAERLCEGYQGRMDQLRVYVATKPMTVHELLSSGTMTTDYDSEWD